MTRAKPSLSSLTVITLCFADFGTKRVPLETSYFEAFNEPHVRLVDTRNETPIERITSTGVLLSSSGENIPLDVLIYATGFENVTRPLTTHIDIRGSNGVKLSDVWLNGPRTYLGMFVPEMPNFMMVVGPSQP
jgi:cation diffusion facilitator CzcD-associated flavoprotein CzcO